MKTNKKAGFTLVEILVVIAIITILSGVVAVNVLRKPDEAKVTAARAQMQELQTALDIYRTEQGRYPTQEQGLGALTRKPEVAPVPEAYPPEGYLRKRQLPKDPWKREFIYVSPGRNQEPFEIISYGRDGEPGGDGYSADLSSAEL